MKKPHKVYIGFTHQEYLEQAERMKQQNKIMYEKIVSDHKLLRDEIKKAMGVNEKDEHLRMIS